MDATAPDDRIQAVVGLVLQAVDQRLVTVREQLLQVTSTIARNHAELSHRIDQCQRLCETLGAAAPGMDPAAAAATSQLVQAANILTERVQFLESRVNQYTDERIAEVTALVARVDSISPGQNAAVATSLHPVATPATAAIDPVSPAVARLAPLGAVTGSTATHPVTASAPAVVPAVVPPVVPVVAPVVAPVAAPMTAPAPVPVADSSVDIALLSAQMSERLAAAVDRALGAMPATVSVPANSA